MSNSRDGPVSIEQATRSCVNWISLLLDNEVGASCSDLVSAEAMALLRSPAPTERSLKMALADGRLLDRLFQRVGVAPADSPNCSSAAEPLPTFVAWCRAKFPASLGRADANQIDANTIASCLDGLAGWNGVARRDDALPVFDRWNSRGQFVDMIRLPEPEAASPVELELVKIINYYRLALAVGDLLAQSPLSYWPASQVSDAFTYHRPLLSLYCLIRSQLQSGPGAETIEKRIESALRRYIAELGKLHARQMSKWQLVTASIVRDLLKKEPRRSRQVRLALKHLTSGDPAWSGRDIEQLLLLPAFHVKSLSKSVAQMADRGSSESLNRARQLISDVDNRLALLLERLHTQVKPSMEALSGLRRSDTFPWQLETLGQLRRQGYVSLVTVEANQERRVRLRCQLWDAVLVLSIPDNGTIERTVNLTPDTEFLQPAVGVNNIRIQQPHVHLLLACESAQDCQAWLEAGRAAKDARYPRAGAEGHKFQQRFFGPEALFEGCFRCRQALVGFSYLCLGDCGLMLDHACLGTLQTPCRSNMSFSRSQSMSGSNANFATMTSRTRGLQSVSGAGGGSDVSKQTATLARLQSQPVGKAADGNAPVYDRI